MRRVGLRPILTWRWALALLFVLLATLTCVRLGIWQLNRFEDKRARAAVIEQHYDAEPIALTDAPSSARSKLAAADDYTVVRARGHYCSRPECVLYVRNRVEGSSVGFWQLVPFETNGGSTFLAVRGWVTTGQTDSVPASRPKVPSGEVELVARLRPREPRLSDRPEVPGQLHSVNATDVLSQVPQLEDVLEGAYGEVVSENGVAPQGLSALGKPSTSLGPHLSYAFQWWIFSAFFVLGFVVAARRTLRDYEGEEESDAASATAVANDVAAAPTRGSVRRYGATRHTRHRSRGTDEDEEDSLLDEGYGS